MVLLVAAILAINGVAEWAERRGKVDANIQHYKRVGAALAVVGVLAVPAHEFFVPLLDASMKTNEEHQAIDLRGTDPGGPQTTPPGNDSPGQQQCVAQVVDTGRPCNP